MISHIIARDEAKEIFDKFQETNEIPVSIYSQLDSDMSYLRKKLLEIEEECYSTDLYEKDLNFAIKLYKCLNDLDGFNETLAGNVGFWRYLCLRVVPDIVYRRHGLVPEYFYLKSGRIYLQALWWYIHMTYQGSLESTFNALQYLTTDYIMNLVERQGRDGFYLPVSRAIFGILSKLPSSVRNQKVNGKILFRRIMIQNTAKQDNYNLAVEDKAYEYAKSLFAACKVEVEDYE